MSAALRIMSRHSRSAGKRDPAVELKLLLWPYDVEMVHVDMRPIRSLVRAASGRALMLRKLQAFRKEIGMGPLSPGAFYLLQKYAPKVLTGDL